MATVHISPNKEPKQSLYSVDELIDCGEEAFVGASGCHDVHSIGDRVGLFLITYEAVVFAEDFTVTWSRAKTKHFRVDSFTKVSISTE